MIFKQNKMFETKIKLDTNLVLPMDKYIYVRLTKKGLNHYIEKHDAKAYDHHKIRPKYEEIWNDSLKKYDNCVRTTVIDLIKIFGDVENLKEYIETDIIFSTYAMEYARLNFKGSFPHQEINKLRI